MGRALVGPPDKSKAMTTVNLQIAATANDCGYYGATWTASSLYIGKISANVCKVALRFLSVAIPQGAIIDSAVLTVWVRGGDGNALTTIYGNDVDDAVSPTSIAELDALALTTASLNQTWAYAGADWYSSSSLVDVIQEIIDRGSWAENNDLQLIIANNSSTYYVRLQDYAANASQAAKLDIEYTEGGGASAVPVIMNQYRQRVL